MYRITFENAIIEKINHMSSLWPGPDPPPPFHWGQILRVHLEVYGNFTSSVAKLGKTDRALFTSHMSLHFDVITAKYLIVL